MAKNTSIISNLTYVDVSNNEPITTHTVNRNIRKLLDNDLALNGVYSSIFGQAQIGEYIEGNTYSFNQLVWFMDDDKQLYILRSLSDGNSNKPRKPFTDYDWNDETEHLDIVQNGLSVLVRQHQANHFYQHEKEDIQNTAEDILYHKYGPVSQGDIDLKILKNDISNADGNRSSMFYPYRTISILKEQPELSNVILDGYCRVWDCGILEYDITYQFGYVGKETYNNTEYTVLCCNNVAFEDMSGKSKAALDYSDNAKYFNSTEDFSIFKYENTDSESNFSIVGSSLQRNRNDIVNTYFADIKFLDNYWFKDDSYMVFGSSTLSEFRDLKTASLSPGANTVTYCNKTRASIMAVLVTFPEDHIYAAPGYNAKNGGIALNSFHCKIIGELDR